MKISIGFASQDMMHTDTVLSLIQLITWTWGYYQNINVCNQRSCYIDDSRNALVKSAQKCGATHLLSIDSDMYFPKDALLDLIQEGKEIIGCNYATRRPPHVSSGIDIDAKKIPPGKEGVKEVIALGMGFVLIDMKVFDAMKFPWFDSLWSPDGVQYGEDTRFFAKAIKAGFKVFCHHDLSKKVGHIGQKTFYLEDDIPCTAKA